MELFVCFVGVYESLRDLEWFWINIFTLHVLLLTSLLLLIVFNFCLVLTNSVGCLNGSQGHLSLQSHWLEYKVDTHGQTWTLDHRDELTRLETRPTRHRHTRITTDDSHRPSQSFSSTDSHRSRFSDSPASDQESCNHVLFVQNERWIYKLAG